MIRLLSEMFTATSHWISTLVLDISSLCALIYISSIEMKPNSKSFELCQDAFYINPSSFQFFLSISTFLSTFFYAIYWCRKSWVQQSQRVFKVMVAVKCQNLNSIAMSWKLFFKSIYLWCCDLWSCETLTKCDSLSQNKTIEKLFQFTQMKNP